MTLYEFKLLKKELQYHRTFTESIFIDYPIKTKRRFVLYAVDKFFVEVEYDKVTNKIINLRSFIEGALLDRRITN